jgi:hypothetical protein
MTPNGSASVLLYGAGSVIYALMAGLILARPPLSRTGTWLVVACAVTAIWAATFALAWQLPIGRVAAWLEVGRSAAWYCFILHLYRRAVFKKEQITTAFKTMGLVALIMLICIPTVEWLSGSVAPGFQSLGIVMRLGFAICNVLLLENLYFNTPTDLRWHINLLCVGLGASFLYDMLLYADGVLFHRLSVVLLEGRAPAVILAAR